MVDLTPNYKFKLTTPNRRGWQDEYYDNFRGVDAALSSILSIADYTGVWANDQDYTVGQKATDGDNSIIYEAQVDHTSASSPTTFLEDRLANTTYWVAWSLPARARGEWATSTAYAMGDFVSDSDTGKFAVCILPHTSSSNFLDDIAAGDWDVLFTATAVSLSDSTPAAIATVGAAGSSSLASRGDHAHAHGAQAGGTLHSVASSGAAGFMSATDKVNLDALVAVSIPSASTTVQGIVELATTAETTTGTDTVRAVTPAGLVGSLWVPPVGAVIDYAGATAPTGWLLCAGQSLLRASYVALFTAIGTVHGAADGTHFSLPDLRGRITVGKDDMNGTAQNRVTTAGSGVDGATLGASGGDQRMHGHTHTVTDPGHTHTLHATGGGGYITSAGSGSAGASAGTGIDAGVGADSSVTNVTNATTGAGASQNMPPVMIMNKIIFCGV